MLRSRSIRALVTGAALVLAVVMPAGAANAARTYTDPDGKVYQALTAFDVAPKGAGYGCSPKIGVQQLENYTLRTMSCSHVNWGRRDVAQFTDSSYSMGAGSRPGVSSCLIQEGVQSCVDLPSWGEEWNIQVTEYPDPTLWGSQCDLGDPSPICINERKTKKPIPNSLRYNADTIWPGDLDSFGTAFMPNLIKGGWLMSQNGRYGLTFQGDGNLVAYGPRNKVLWSSGTWGHPQANLVLQQDGNLVISDADGSVLWHSGTWGNPASMLKVQDDGNVVLYRLATKPNWNNTATEYDYSKPGKALWYTGWDR